jgi:membrane protease YdiL (CAAX protease family)
VGRPNASGDAVVQLPLWRPLLLGVLALGACVFGSEHSPAREEEWRVAAFWAAFVVPLIDWLLVARHRRYSLRAVLGTHRIGGHVGLVAVTVLAVLGVRLGWWSLRLWLTPGWGEGAPTSLDVQTPALQLPLAVVVVVVGPIVEEIAFRGIVFRRLLRRLPPWLAAAGTSLLFGAAHFDLVGSTLLGLALVALYVQTRSLWVSISAHALSNLLALFAAVLFEPILERTWLVVALQLLGAPWLFLLFRRSLRQLPAFPRG